MMHGPLRLLICAYGASALAAAGLMAFGAGGLVAALIFWIGGALAVPALAAPPGLHGFFRREAAPEDPSPGEIEAALAAWREDAACDRAEAAALSREGAG